MFKMYMPWVNMSKCEVKKWQSQLCGREWGESTNGTKKETGSTYYSTRWLKSLRGPREDLFADSPLTHTTLGSSY